MSADDEEWRRAGLIDFEFRLLPALATVPIAARSLQVRKLYRYTHSFGHYRDKAEWTEWTDVREGP